LKNLAEQGQDQGQQQETTKVEAKKALETLKKYFMQSKEDSSAVLIKLDDIEDYFGAPTIQSNIIFFNDFLFFF